MRALLILWTILLLGGLSLLAWNHHLDHEDEQARDHRERIGRLVRAEERDVIDTAGLAVGPLGKPPFLYAPDQNGNWICLNFHGVPAASGAIDALLSSLMQAEGTVRSRDRAKEAEYGLGLPATLTVRVVGSNASLPQDLDEQLGVELGSPTADEKGSFVRRLDDDGIWAIDRNPRNQLLVRARTPRPPLLDPHVVPAVWPEKSRRINRVQVYRNDGTSYEVTLHERKLTQQQMLTGETPYEWRISQGDVQQLAHQGVARGHHNFLLSIPWMGVVDANEAPGLGFDQPLTRLVLHPFEGEPLELRVGSVALPSGNWPVGNLLTGRVFEITPQVVALLAPDPALLHPGHEDDPYSEWFRSGGE